MTSLGLELGLSLSQKNIGGFSPLEYNPSLWLDAADQTTIILNGPNVAQWDDKSGNGAHAAQGITASQPLYDLAAQNGKNVIDFDGIDDYMVGLLDSFQQAYSIFIVGSLSAIAQTMFSWGDGFGLFGIDLCTPGSSFIRFLHREPLAVSGGDSLLASQAITFDQIYVFSFTRNNFPNMEVFYNNVSKGTVIGVDGFFGAGGLYFLGTLGTVPRIRYLNGSLCEVIVYPRVTASEINLTNNYLLGKWGV